MSIEVKGIQQLIDYFDKIGNQKVPKKALDQAGKHVLKVEKEVAQSTHNKYTRHVGYNNLKSFPPRVRKGKGTVDIGIKGSSNWDAVKGLYFNHYGFYHNGWHREHTAKNRIQKGKSSGKYISGSRWMDNAYEKSSSEAYKILERELLEGLKLK